MLTHRLKNGAQRCGLPLSLPKIDEIFFIAPLQEVDFQQKY
jgi:hypothetical protein